ncbi:Helix-turn-helix domain protein [anaerobic digester metagenome]
MNVLELTKNIIPEAYNIQKQGNRENTSYHGVVECVLHFDNGKYKTISSDNAKDLLSVNIIRYNHKSEMEVDFIERVLMHYKDSGSIEDLARRCGYKSTKTFTRYFKRIFDTTPKQWLFLIKKNEVIHYLQNTNIPINEIVSITGFCNMSHLAYFCKTKIGSSPTEIRNEAIEDNKGSR